jgi:hypothetical protein
LRITSFAERKIQDLAATEEWTNLETEHYRVVQ